MRSSIVRRGALLLSTATVLFMVERATAQAIGTGYGNGNGTGNGSGNGTGNGTGNGRNGAGSGVGAGANQYNPGYPNGSRNRFILNTSITGAGILYATPSPVTQFGQGLNSSLSQQGNLASQTALSSAVTGSSGLPGQQQGGNVDLNPPGVLMNMQFNGSANFAIYGNQQVSGIRGGQQGGYPGGGYGGNPYGGGFPGGGFPGGGFPGGFPGFQNGGYGY